MHLPWTRIALVTFETTVTMKFLIFFSFLALVAGESDPAPSQASAYVSRPVLPYVSQPASSYNPGYSGKIHFDSTYFDALDSINSHLENAEAKENTQTDRVNELSDSANANNDFANNFRTFVEADIQREQTQQDYRLNEIEERIAQINAVRAQVNSLNAVADAAREETNQILEEQQDFVSAINNVRNDNAQNVRIAEAQLRANAVNARIDEVMDAAAVNNVSLGYLEINARRTIDYVNLTQLRVSNIEISPSGTTGPSQVTVPFEPALAGTPQIATFYPVGLRAQKVHSYGYEYPSIYFGINTDVCFDREIATASDMSSGGWQVDHVAVLQRAKFFSIINFEKSFLEGI